MTTDAHRLTSGLIATKLVALDVRFTHVMSSITIKDIPHNLLERLRARAALDKRSMNKAIIHLLDQALSETNDDPAIRLREQLDSHVQAWSRLAGRWDSDRGSAEEIDEIYAARSEGRTVTW
ncbi:MAG: FitA-like ribbon-helix-helix domain-containing protein [Gammaproteobacteria bacterium]